MIILRKLSSWQKRDCIACSRDAIAEVAIGQSIAVRCCLRLACFIYAVKEAIDCFKTLARRAP